MAQWHVTQLTDEAAMRHARLTIGILDRPDIGIGWTPYNFLVTFGAVSQWACHSQSHFDGLCKAKGLQVTHWTPWENGVRSAVLTEAGK